MDSFREQIEASRPIQKTRAQIDAEKEERVIQRVIQEADYAEKLIKEAVLHEAKNAYQGSKFALRMGLYVQLCLIGHLELLLPRGEAAEAQNKYNDSIFVDICDVSESSFFGSVVSTQRITLTKSAHLLKDILKERLSGSGFSFEEWKVGPVPGNYYDDSTPSIFETPKQFDGVTTIINDSELFPIPITIIRKASYKKDLQFLPDSQQRKVSITCRASQLVLPFTYE